MAKRRKIESKPVVIDAEVTEAPEVPEVPEAPAPELGASAAPEMTADLVHAERWLFVAPDEAVGLGETPELAEADCRRVQHGIARALHEVGGMLLPTAHEGGFPVRLILEGEGHAIESAIAALTVAIGS